MAMALSKGSLALGGSYRPALRQRRPVPLKAQLIDSKPTSPASEIMKDLKPGEYFSPPAEETSAVRGNLARFKRSPCPALNTLANHGYINRDGRGLTLKAVAHAVEKVFNLERRATMAAAVVIRVLNNSVIGLPFNLSDISIHNRVEHDASLAHDDAYFGKDPCRPNPELVRQLCALSEDGETIKLAEVVKFRKMRQADSQARNPQFKMTQFHSSAAAAEVGLLLNILGHNGSIPVSHAKSFLIDEKLPEDFVRPDTPLGLEDITGTQTKVKEAMQSEGSDN